MALVENVKITRSDRIRFLTFQQLDTLIASVPDDPFGRMERTLYNFAARTGLRRGECLGLRWEDVDYHAEQIRVVTSHVRGEDGSPKSGKPRAVPLSPTVATILEEHFKRTEFRSRKDRVFAHPDTGKPYDPSKLQKRFKKALAEGRIGEFREVERKSGKVESVPVFCFHDLRHTYGTTLAAGGAKPIEIKTYMGHADLKTTERYMHHAPVQNEAQQVEEAFRRLEDQAALEAVEAD